MENGAELQSIHDTVRYRSRALPGGGHPMPEQQPPAAGVSGQGLDMQTDSESAPLIVQRLLDSGKPAAISIYLSGASEALRAAVAVGDEAKLEDALDRITAVAAVAASFEPSGQVAERAITALHNAFDLGLRSGDGPTSFPSDRLFAGVLARARAVGALAVRLQHWRPLRHLILHDVDVEGPRVWSNWFRYGDVWASRSGTYRAENNVLEGSRAPLRLAAQHALRLPALRPDGISDEDALITSVCQFDFLTNLVTTWEALGDKPGEASFPYFAAWDGDRVRPAVSRVMFDAECRAALLPGISDADLAALVLYVAERANGATEGMGSWGFWDGFVDGRVRSFLDEYAPRS